MPVKGTYSWTQNPNIIEVTVPLKGVPSSQVDIYASDVFLKINFAPYLVTIDLFDAVDELSSVAKFAGGSLVLTLRKITPATWDNLECQLPKVSLKARRDASVAAKTAKDEDLRKKKSERRYEDEQMAMKSQWALDDAERQQLEDLKAEEKRNAEEEMYAAFAKITAQQQQQPSQPQAAPKRVTAPTAAASTAPSTGVADLDDIDDVDDLPPKPAGVVPTPSVHAPAAPPAQPSKPSKNIFTTAEAEAAPAAEPETELSYLPPPRQSARVDITFTERPFPTPLRESHVAQEEDWIAKNKHALDKRRKQTNPDARDISERDPMWLKGKGDDFYRRKDYMAARNAYSAALDADPESIPCLLNRAACCLLLHEYSDAVTDCTSAEALILAAKSDDDTTKRHLVRALVRRATARCKLGAFSEAVSDYENAIRVTPDDAALGRDLLRVHGLATCSKAKARGDAAFGTGDYQTAIELYTHGLEADPAFVSCYSNRAACYLALNQYESCINDCTKAIDLMSQQANGADTQGPTGPVPVAGSDKFKEWMRKTVVRRATAAVKLGRLQDAEADYRRAVELDPTNEALLMDLTRIQVRLNPTGTAAAVSATEAPVATA